MFGRSTGSAGRRFAHLIGTIYVLAAACAPAGSNDRTVVRDAETRRPCYSSVSGGVTLAAGLAEARAVAEQIVGKALPVPLGVPAWVSDITVGEVRPLDPGVSQGAQIGFAPSGNDKAPLIEIVYTPLPLCEAFERENTRTLSIGGVAGLPQGVMVEGDGGVDHLRFGRARRLLVGRGRQPYDR